MVKTDPKLYGKYIVRGPNGSLISYVQLKKAVYVLIRSAFLLNEKLIGDLEANIFKLNPYD